MLFFKITCNIGIVYWIPKRNQPSSYQDLNGEEQMWWDNILLKFLKFPWKFKVIHTIEHIRIKN